MDLDLLSFYDDFTLGVAAYQRVSSKKFKIIYINNAGATLDNIGQNHLGRFIDDIFPELNGFGLIDQLEEVYLSAEELVLPFTPYQTPLNKEYIYRANKIKKMGEDIIVNIYNDESETYSYINEMKQNKSKLDDALHLVSHNIRGDVSTSLGMMELIKLGIVGEEQLENSLDMVKKKIENIDYNIHDLVRLLYKKSNSA
ncbi:hypothetical protein [Flammeovirga sp. SubArs3]|uniref:hypothetical protein n=1 Tax=Flammeovirga sp. SubArs3 TaxID=2995316 RepID=UPI00248D0C38|nr:hypothetical protein [Flammeovirga sp. SubArs3]